MPNPKVGTVTPDVAAVKNAKAGQVQFRVDKAGIVHATIGRRSFDADSCRATSGCPDGRLNKAKPASSKVCICIKGGGFVHHGRGRVRVDIPFHRGVIARNWALAVRSVWWALAPVGSSKTVGVQATALNGQRRWRSRCDGMQVSLTVGRCNVGVRRQNPQGACKEKTLSLNRSEKEAVITRSDRPRR